MAEALVHAHEALLAVVQEGEPGGREVAVGVGLEAHPGGHAVVAEEDVAVAIGGVGAAGVPALAIDHQDTAGRGRELVRVADLDVVRRMAPQGAMGAGDEPGGAVRRAHVVEHPQGVHHHRCAKALELVGDVAVQPLRRLARAQDA